MSGTGREPGDGLAAASRRAAERAAAGEKDREPSLAARLGQIGVLGWAIVVPTLLGLFLGRLLDEAVGSGITFAAALLFLGVAVGFWSAWKWMHRQ